MRRFSTFLLLTVLFVLLTAQSSCRERACETLDAVGAVREQLAAAEIVFDSDEELLTAILDGTIDELIGDKIASEDALAAIRGLLAVIRALCPADREALGQMLRMYGPLGGPSVDAVGLLERRLAALAGEDE